MKIAQVSYSNSKTIIRVEWLGYIQVKNARESKMDFWILRNGGKRRISKSSEHQ